MKTLRKTLSLLLILLLAAGALPALAASQVKATISRTTAVIDLADGDTLKLTSSVLPASASQSVVWATSKSAVATVQGGLVTAKKVGKVRIGVRPSTVRKWAICTVTVKDSSAPTGMTLSAKAITLPVGGTKTVEATLKPSTAYQGVKWQSSKSSVATVSATGVVTAKREGTALIRATSTRNTALRKSLRVTVEAVNAPTELAIEPNDTAMEIGDKLTLSAVPTPADASDLVTWASSNTAVAKVSAAGVVTALAAGNVTIRARSTADTSVYADRKITVSNADMPASVSIDQQDCYLSEGDKLTLTATVKPATADQGVSWSSSKTAVATVSASGVVTAKGNGSATITVKTNTGGLKDDIVVKVLEANRSTDVPSLTTAVSGISANRAKIQAIYVSAVNELESLDAAGSITASEKATRKNVLVNAFAMYDFPWMTTKSILYWKGGSYYYPGYVYYGLPYTQTNRTYNTAKMVGYFTQTGGYYKTSSLPSSTYPGNDCSSFVSMSVFGANSGYSYLNSTAIYSSSQYRTLSGFTDMRPGDIFVKNGHVVMFLYYTTSSKSSVMVIEQGGGKEPNTVACRIRALSYYAGSGTYIARRKAAFAS